MNKSEKIRLYYGIFLSVLTAAVGIVFIIQVTLLYYSGLKENLEVIYTTERIGDRLTLPLVFLCVWIAAIIAGYVLSVVFPIKEKRVANVNYGRNLALLKPRVPTVGLKDGFDDAKRSMRREEIIRFVVWGVACAVLLTGAIFIMIYAYTPSNFHGAGSWKSDIFGLVKNVIWWVAAGLVCCIGAVIYEGISLKREIGFAKNAIATGDRKSLPPAKQVTKNFILFVTIAMSVLSLGALVLYIIAPIILNSLISPIVKGTSSTAPTGTIIALAFLFLIIVVSGLCLHAAIKKYMPEKAEKIMLLCTRIAVGAVAVAFIITGALNGGAQDVLIKAINICTECIGLG